MAVYNYTIKSLRQNLEELYTISTKAGALDSGVRLNKAGRETADYIFEKYQQAGLINVRKQFFPLERWWPEQYNLNLLFARTERPIVAFPLWYTEKAEDLCVEITDIGYGTPGELRGKEIKGKAALLQMKRIFHFLPSFDQLNVLSKLVKKGAAAVIVVNTLHDVPGGMMAINHDEILATRAKNIELYPLPAFSIGKGEGEFLQKSLLEGAVKVRFNLKISRTVTQACNIIGELPGNENTDETIVVGGHYDTWFGGALDNLSSQAGMIELAHHFASLPISKRPRSMIFTAIFGHEYGNQGHFALAEELDSIKNQITCFYNLDGSGSIGFEVDHRGQIFETGYNDICGIVSSSNALSKIAYKYLYEHDIFSVHFYDNAQIGDLHGPLSLLGIPTLLIINKDLFYHTPLDTPDLIPPDLHFYRMEVNKKILADLMNSKPGYYMATNTNPYRNKEQENLIKADLPLGQLPTNPRPWVDGPPQDLFFEVIPPKPKVFSPVIVWRSHSVTADISQVTDIKWTFHNLLDKLLPNKRLGPATGTIYMLPGLKTIRMTVSDRKGRQTSVERKIKVTW